MDSESYDWQAKGTRLFVRFLIVLSERQPSVFGKERESPVPGLEAAAPTPHCTCSVVITSEYPRQGCVPGSEARRAVSGERGRGPRAWGVRMEKL